MNNMIKAILETRKRAIEPMKAVMETGNALRANLRAVENIQKRAIKDTESIVSMVKNAEKNFTPLRQFPKL